MVMAQMIVYKIVMAIGVDLFLILMMMDSVMMSMSVRMILKMMQIMTVFVLM
jgi:hypothetical protein